MTVRVAAVITDVIRGGKPVARYGEAMRKYGLFRYEEAGNPLDYQLLAEPAKTCAGVMETGENLFSHQDARNLARYGGMRPDLMPETAILSEYWT